MLRQAVVSDIPCLEALYRKRVNYNDHHHIHQWREADVTWEALSKTYRIEDFYVIEEAGVLKAAACFVEHDPAYWPELAPHTSYSLHKICVDPSYSKQGYSGELITLFKQKGKELGVPDVRLDVRAHKKKLRAMYEAHGFELVRIASLFEGYETALYRYQFASEKEMQ